MKKLGERALVSIVLGGGLLVGGCDDSAEAPSTLRTVPPQAAAPAGADPAGADSAPVAAHPSATPSSAAAATAGTGQVSEPTPGAAREKAQVGVGEKGRGYGGGIITEPVHQYFAGKDRITFEIEIPQAMKLFQAEHNRFPRDMKEFQKAILEPSQIVLPELPAGDRYVYDAKEHELMVEHHALGQ